MNLNKTNAPGAACNNCQHEHQKCQKKQLFGKMMGYGEKQQRGPTVTAFNKNRQERSIVKIKVILF